MTAPTQSPGSLAAPAGDPAGEQPYPATRPARSKCRYCREGNAADDKGEHWIVKSIFPARIDIRKCRDVVPAPVRGNPIVIPADELIRRPKRGRSG